MKMKKLMIAVASLMLVANVQAEEGFEIGVEMTPMPKQEKVAATKSDTRFADYALEKIAAGGQ